MQVMSVGDVTFNGNTEEEEEPTIYLNATNETLISTLAPTVAPTVSQAPSVSAAGRLDSHGVDDIALPRSPPLDQRGENARHQKHRSAAKITDHIERWDRWLAVFTDRVQHASHANIVDIMPRHLGPWSGLAPAGHSAIDQPGI